MASLLELRVGPFHAPSLLIVVTLVALDAAWTLRIHRHLRSQDRGTGPGYGLGLAVGVWFRSILIAIAGVFTLYGSLLAFALFAAGVIWRGMGPGRHAVEGFLAGYRDATGESRPGLASAFGAGWVAITRGIPLLVLYSLGEVTF